jgi:hypothetical protein
MIGPHMIDASRESARTVDDHNPRVRAVPIGNIKRADKMSVLIVKADSGLVVSQGLRTILQNTKNQTAYGREQEDGSHEATDSGASCEVPSCRGGQTADHQTFRNDETEWKQQAQQRNMRED